VKAQRWAARLKIVTPPRGPASDPIARGPSTDRGPCSHEDGAALPPVFLSSAEAEDRNFAETSESSPFSVPPAPWAASSINRYSLLCWSFCTPPCQRISVEMGHDDCVRATA